MQLFAYWMQMGCITFWFCILIHDVDINCDSCHHRHYSQCTRKCTKNIATYVVLCARSNTQCNIKIKRNEWGIEIVSSIYVGCRGSWCNTVLWRDPSANGKMRQIYWCGVRENPRRKVKQLFSICMDIDLVSHSTVQLRARTNEEEKMPGIQFPTECHNQFSFPWNNQKNSYISYGKQFRWRGDIFTCYAQCRTLVSHRLILANCQQQQQWTQKKNT